MFICISRASNPERRCIKHIRGLNSYSKPVFPIVCCVELIYIQVSAAFGWWSVVECGGVMVEG